MVLNVVNYTHCTCLFFESDFISLLNLGRIWLDELGVKHGKMQTEVRKNAKQISLQTLVFIDILS